MAIENQLIHMKSIYYSLFFAVLAICISSCKVRYGAHFHRTNTPSYLQDKQPVSEISPPAEELLVSRETDKLVPAKSRKVIQPEAIQPVRHTQSSALIKKINQSINKLVPDDKPLDISKDPDAFLTSYRSLEKREQKKIKKAIKSVIKKELKSKKHTTEIKSGYSAPLATESRVLLIILAVLLPPLAVGLHQGALNNTFWLNLLLTLLFYLPGMIHALIVVTK